MLRASGCSFFLILATLCSGCNDYSSAEKYQQDSIESSPGINLEAVFQNNDSGEFSITLPLNRYQWSGDFSPTQAVVLRSVSEPEMYEGVLTREIIFSVDLFTTDGSIVEMQRFNLASYRVVDGSEETVLDGRVLQNSCDASALSPPAEGFAEEQPFSAQDFFSCYQPDTDIITKIVSAEIDQDSGHVTFQTAIYYAASDTSVENTASLTVMLTVKASGEVCCGMASYISNNAAGDYFLALGGNSTGSVP